ncbi:MAG: hypothetical protein AB7H93_13345 [Vicinamibacterales bacterium]
MKAGTVLKLALPRYLDNQPQHLRAGAAETLAVVLAAADEFNAQLAAVTANPDLSPQGRTNGRRRVAADALAKLLAVETTTIKNLADRAATLERGLLGRATVAPPTDPAERIAFELRLQEIRGQLRQLPPTERLSVYLTTADPMTLAAIDTAPMTASEPRRDGTRRLEPFIDPEARTAAALARGAHDDPASAKTLAEVRSLREAYALAVGSVRKEILDEAPGATATETTS